MTILRNIILALVLVASGMLAFYLFFWFVILLIIAAPVLYLWWKIKIRKIKNSKVKVQKLQRLDQ